MKNLVNALCNYEFEQRENSFFLTTKLLKKLYCFYAYAAICFYFKKTI